MATAIDVIKSEHRNLIALLQCFEGIVRDIEDGDMAPDFVLFRAMVDYIESFLGRYHHPKEDRYLFRLLRRRDPESAAKLDRLEEEHRECPKLVARLRETLDAYEREGPSKAHDFFVALRVYHRFEWDHMRTEEMEILPAARARLTGADWAEIDAAFRDHDDPLFGDRRREAFRGLYSRIVASAPAPHGLGQRTPK